MIRDKIDSVIQDARSNTMNNKYGSKKIILTENYTDQILAIIRSEMDGMKKELVGGKSMYGGYEYNLENHGYNTCLNAINKRLGGSE